jgi:hypothetical protein
MCLTELIGLFDWMEGGKAALDITWGNMAPEKRGSPADCRKSTNLTGGRISALKKEEIYGAFNHSMTRPQVANGGSELQIRRVAENISNTCAVIGS